MNEVLQQLYTRKSVRAFEETEISPQEKQAILQAAFEAPSAGNQQLYTILDITDSDLKQALSETCDHQPFIAKAPMVLVFCADCQKWLDAFSACGCAPRRPGPGDLLLAAADACICLLYTSLAGGAAHHHDAAARHACLFQKLAHRICGLKLQTLQFHFIRFHSSHPFLFQRVSDILLQNGSSRGKSRCCI